MQTEDFLFFEEFPFITGVRAAKDLPEEIKACLPFRLRFNLKKGLIVQDSSPEVDAQLKLIYQKGSMISTPLGSGSLNLALADEIIRFIDISCGGLEGKAFMEPGCGTGFLLKRIFDKGAKKVVGCEPGPQGQPISNEYGFVIHRGFLDTLVFDELFDCVYHYGVLEHIKEPEKFLRQSMDMLGPSGVLFAAVPECRQDMELGNFMILAHQHYNYFTERSLKRLFIQVGLQEVEVRRFEYSKGIICAWGRKPLVSARNRLAISEDSLRQEQELLRLFIQKTKKYLSLFQARVQRLEEEGKSIGFYGAPRPLVGLLRFKRSPRNFDGDPYKHGCYFSGSSSPVEPPRKLIAEPVDELWILPIHHDKAIRDYLLKESLLSESSIFSVLGFMQENSSLDGLGLGLDRESF
ncbi:MAG: methyltransferase domain-containing protein [Candidatus Omnitrophica bacterium]|nr:methyltransferase domain-containing protein [Candidatus Omnitrophota bacterium]